MTFYLKYRPQKLEDLDLTDVRESLKKIIKSKKIPHAFLFSGPKGSGKTSAARIIAKIVNCKRGKGNNPPAGGEPCNKCAQCISITNGSNIDVIELDAASHRGIDDVRMLRDAVKLAPASAKKKVYIIDESHMLTTEASNALLKTLEEPPEHVMFILATTNPEKLIETIRSRAVNITFKKATASEIVRSLSAVVKGEKLKVEKGALEMIAKASEGSFRDAVIILEQLVVEKKKLESDVIGEYLFQKKAFDVDEFLSLLSEKDAKKALTAIENAIEKGANAKIILRGIVERLRESLMVKTGLEGEDLEYFSREEVVLLIKLFSRTESEIDRAIIDQLPMEIAVIEWCGRFDKKNQDSIADTDRKSNKALEIKRKSKRKSKKADNPGHKKRQKNMTEKKIESLEEDIWMRILSNIKPRNASTEALLRATRPVNYDGETLELGVFYRFHKERLESNFHRSLLEEVASEILGNGIRVVCTLTEQLRSSKIEQTSAATMEPEIQSEQPEVTLTESEDEDIIKVAKEIFGS